MSESDSAPDIRVGDLVKVRDRADWLEVDEVSGDGKAIIASSPSVVTWIHRWDVKALARPIALAVTACLLFACATVPPPDPPPENDSMTVTVDRAKCSGLVGVSGPRQHVEKMVSEWCRLQRVAEVKE